MAKLRVGLTGGIGSGKSAVAARWAERGATIIDGDVLARDVVTPGTAGLAEIAARWPQVIRADGSLDRAALAAVVFNDRDALAALNGIVHPRVRERAELLEREAPDGVIVHVVPLLFEGDYWRRCDATVVVIAPRDARIARVVARDRADPADVERRMAAQIDPEAARARATFTIENDGDLDALRGRADSVYAALERQRAV